MIKYKSRKSINSYILYFRVHQLIRFARWVMGSRPFLHFFTWPDDQSTKSLINPLHKTRHHVIITLVWPCASTAAANCSLSLKPQFYHADTGTVLASWQVPRTQEWPELRCCLDFTYFFKSMSHQKEFYYFEILNKICL